jgi:hypothetical protein
MPPEDLIDSSGSVHGDEQELMVICDVSSQTGS